MLLPRTWQVQSEKPQKEKSDLFIFLLQNKFSWRGKEKGFSFFLLYRNCIFLFQVFVSEKLLRTPQAIDFHPFLKDTNLQWTLFEACHFQLTLTLKLFSMFVENFPFNFVIKKKKYRNVTITDSDTDCKRKSFVNKTSEKWKQTKILSQTKCIQK